MTSSSEPKTPREVFLSPGAAEYFQARPDDEKTYLQKLINRIRTDPTVDGSEIFEVEANLTTWRVLVTAEFSVYFRLDGADIHVDSIGNTSDNVKKSIVPTKGAMANARQDSFLGALKSYKS